MEDGLGHLNVTSGRGPACSVWKPGWGSYSTSSCELTDDCQLGVSDQDRS